MTPFETIVRVYWFCSNQAPRTGLGTPEMDVYISTILSANSASGEEPDQRLAVIRCRIEEAIAHYRAHRETSQGEWWYTNYHRLVDERTLAAYQDLTRRIDQEEWSLPLQTIRPIIYTVHIQGEGKEQLRAFSDACYRASVFDLRSTHQQSWKAGDIRREPIKSYADISRQEDQYGIITRRAQHLFLPGEKIVLLFAEDDALFPSSLTQRLVAADYELLPFL